MSYLQLPRLNFSGRFQADPSTVNNDISHFDSAGFQGNFDDLQTPQSPNGWWNPAGSGAWNFYQCQVTSVTYKDGTVCDDPALDPIIGSTVTGGDARVSGKIVDLDPQQQMVSELFGFEVNIASPARPLGFKSKFVTAPFADIAFSRCPTAQGDAVASAFYQSVLKIDDWTDNKKSRLISELCPEQADQKMLSIKFIVDGYNWEPTSPDFTFGRVTGSIGNYSENEPYRFVSGRTLANPRTQTGSNSLNTAYAVIENKKLFIDLGNSLQTTSPYGPFTDIGNIYAACLTSNGETVILGEISYLDNGWYARTAGIACIDLTDEHAKLAEANPLAIMLSPGTPNPVLLAESAAGFVRADVYVFRMDPGEKRTTKLYATVLGKPYANGPISLAIAGTNGSVPDPMSLCLPASALTFPATLTTDENGVAELEMTSSDPGNPRVYIDGQLYFINYCIGATPPPPHPNNLMGLNSSQLINIRVYSGIEVPEHPCWMEYIQPIFQQYANLYPVMRPIVDLGNYSSVVGKLYILKNVFTMDIDNPNYMPVTRDLSEAKKKMILKWIDNPIYMDLDSKEDLIRALQTAIELEHSTIPVYLSALYTIKPGCNQEVAGLIRSVVLEEMLHMALVCNILISIGGSPNIGHPNFIPGYPTSLPGGLRPGLIVSLKKCSIDQIRDCFMSIEEPDEILIPRRRLLFKNANEQTEKYTIKWFYQEILKALGTLCKQGELTFGNLDKQVTEWKGAGQLYSISSLADAEKAIREIMEQGEGANVKDPNDPDDELAHYYKFAEIVEGRHLVKVPDGWGYVGARIPFDQNGVWPMMDNPYNSTYPNGSRAQILNNQFSATYKALLLGLNRTFNGEPHYLKDTIGLMYSLEVIAAQLVQQPSGLGDGSNAGPAFQI